VRGNADEELRFVAPDGQVLTSGPSPRWTLVTDPKTLPDRREGAKDSRQTGPDPGSRSP